METMWMWPFALLLVFFLKNAQSFNCSRIMFRQPSSDSVLAYKEIINGIYVKQQKIKDGFPVYLHERGEIFFSFDRSNTSTFYFSSPTHLHSDMLGLSALTNISNSLINITAPSSILYWRQWNTKASIWQALINKLQVVCTDDSPRPIISCGESNNLLFFANYPVTSKHEFRPLRDYTGKLFYQSLRMVYVNVNTKSGYRYLSYFNGQWNMATHYTSESPNMAVHWRSRDQALKPEHITKAWIHRYNSGSAYIQCKGVLHKCTQDYCGYDGVCHENSLGQSICVCAFSYTGKTCRQARVESCPSPGDNFYSLNSFERSMAIAFFPGNNQAKFHHALCINGIWTDEDNEFSLTTRKPFITPRVTRTETKSVSIIARLAIGIWVVLGIGLACCCRKNPSYVRFFSLLSYIVMWLSIIYAPFYLLLQHNENPKYYKIGTWLLPTAIACYFFVLIETFVCSEMKYVTNTYKGEEKLDAYIRGLIATRPTIKVHAVCYHIEVTHNTTAYKDGSGNIQFKTEKKKKRVDTWKGNEEFEYDSWQDVSSEFPNLNGDIARLKLYKNIQFKDTHTKIKFEEFGRHFYNRVKNYDHSVDYWETFEIAGLKDKITGLFGGRPWWFNGFCLFLAHVLLVGFPFRWYVKSKSTQTSHTFVKEITCG